MDKALPKLLAFPPHPPPASGFDEAEYDKHAREIVRLMSTLPAKGFTQPVDGKHLLQVLDPAVNTLPFLYALSAQASLEKTKDVFKPSEKTWKSIETFISVFDPVQVRYAGFEFRVLLEDLLSCALNSSDASQATRALELVQTAMIRLDPTTSTFTSTHLALVRTCLTLRSYTSCLQVLDNDIYHFPVKTDGPNHGRHIPRPCASSAHISSSTYVTTSSGFSRDLTYRDHVQYFLFGGMIYVSQRKWSRALLLLELATGAPQTSHNSVSLIQVEAYKKWLLVSILEHQYGTTKAAVKGVPPLPSTALSSKVVAPQTAKLLSSLAKPYISLAEAYGERGPSKLFGEYTAGVQDEIWQNDQNHGLVKLVIGSHRRSQVLSYSKVYASIPLGELAEMISRQDLQAGEKGENPATVEKEIRETVASGSVDAAIVPAVDGSDGGDMLRFLSPDGRVAPSDAQQALRLQTAIGKIDKLNGHIKDSQRRLELTKEYLAAARQKRNQGGDGHGGDGGTDFAGVTPGGMEEDMLADL